MAKDKLGGKASAARTGVTDGKPATSRKRAPDRKRPTDEPAAVRTPGAHLTAADTGPDATGTGGQHHAAKAHGKPARVDESLPATRDELLALHAEARKRRAAAELGSEAFRAAVDEIARIEVRVAAVDRAADPPLG